MNSYFDVTQALPVHAICTQIDETDLAFFKRLLVAEGLSYRFTHMRDSEEMSDNHAKHHFAILENRLYLSTGNEMKINLGQ